MPVSSWDLVPGNNNSAPPNGWPEGMVPSDVNNVGRQMMADVRAFYDSFATLQSSVNALVAALPATYEALALKALKPSDTSRNSVTSVADDPDLSIAIPAAGTYAVRTYIAFWNATTTAQGFKWRWNTTGSTTSILSSTVVLNGALTNAGQNNLRLNFTNSVANAIVASNPPDGEFMYGVIKFSAAQTLSLQWAQNSSSANATTVGANSYVLLERLA